MRTHPIYMFEKLEVGFCKHYQIYIDRWTSAHGIMNDKASWKWKGGSILWTYIETNKLPLASNKRQFAHHFFLSKIATIPLDSHRGDERDTLFEHNEAIVTCEESMGNANKH
jgi:hypothetical protein